MWRKYDELTERQMAQAATMFAGDVVLCRRDELCVEYLRREYGYFVDADGVFCRRLRTQIADWQATSPFVEA